MMNVDLKILDKIDKFDNLDKFDDSCENDKNMNSRHFLFDVDSKVNSTTNRKKIDIQNTTKIKVFLNTNKMNSYNLTNFNDRNKRSMSMNSDVSMSSRGSMKHRFLDSRQIMPSKVLYITRIFCSKNQNFCINVFIDSFKSKTKAKCLAQFYGKAQEF